MAIALDTSTNGGTNSGIGALNYNHTVTGSNTVLLVGVYDSSSDGITGATYNSVAMTQLVKVAVGSGEVYIYGLLNPTTGTNQVHITQIAVDTIYAASTSFTGVKQSGLPDATASSTGTGNRSTSITTIAANTVAFAASASIGAAMVASTGLTTLLTNVQLTSYDSSTFPIVAPGAYTIAATVSSTPSTGLIAVSLAPSVAPLSGFFFL